VGTGSLNAVRLTDGLAGLAAGLTAIVAGTFAVFAYVFGRIDWTRYLLVYFLPGSQELTIFCGALAGAALGFLWFNAHPAQVFMGDTGALAIGGALGTLAIMLTAQFLLLGAGGALWTVRGCRGRGGTASSRWWVWGRAAWRRPSCWRGRACACTRATRPITPTAATRSPAWARWPA